MKTIDQNKTLNFIFLVGEKQKNNPFFSLEPEESDLATNQLILNALIGTLVKYGNSGRLEPYLAERIEVLNDDLKWIFKLKKNLTCQDGSPITAPKFKTLLEKQLRTYLKKGPVLEFEKLKNWIQFTQNKPFDGIEAEDENTLIFNFSKKPNLFLEFLRMPYFGYWCDRGVSSGAYQIEENNNNQILTLSLRKNWFSVSKSSPKKIIFKSITEKEIIPNQKNSIIHFGTNSPNDSYSSGFNFIYSVPTLLTSLILNPTTSIFKNKTFRTHLFKKIINSSFSPYSKNKIRAYSFIVSNENGLLPIENSEQKILDTSNLNIALGTPLSIDDLRPLKEILHDSFPNINFEFIEPDKSKPDWRNQLLSNEKYDARIATVDAGGSFQNASIKMIFCSQLGVRYPDPSGNICKLVNSYEILEKEIDKEYINRFNETLFEDASVIPLYFGSTTWMISKNIDRESLPPSVLYVQFENITIK